MDWRNPVTYGVIITAAIAFGSVLWRVFWWVAKIDPLPDGLAKTNGQIEQLAREIRGDIKSILRLLPGSTVAGASPLQLTDTGRSVAERLDAHEWARKLAPKLLDEVAGLEPFQIDQFSERYAERRLSDEMTTRVAKYVYESGRVRARVLSVLHIVLRDELLRLTN